MAYDEIICPDCHTIVRGGEQDCPNCTAGLVPLGGDGAAKAFRLTQIRLRRQLGIKPRNQTTDEAISDLKFEKAALPKGNELASRSVEERSEIEELRHSINRQLAELRPMQGLQATASPTSTHSFLVECPQCGAASADPTAVFCQKCGERIVGEEVDAVVQQVLASVQAAIPQMVREELGKRPARTVEWDQLPDTEKWKTAWGVWWRTLVASVGLYIVLMIILISIVAFVQ